MTFSCSVIRADCDYSARRQIFCPQFELCWSSPCPATNKKENDCRKFCFSRNLRKIHGQFKQITINYFIHRIYCFDRMFCEKPFETIKKNKTKLKMFLFIYSSTINTVSFPSRIISTETLVPASSDCKRLI